MADTPWNDADEGRHPGSPVEAWWWWAHDQGCTAGLFVGFEIHTLAGRTRFDYWAGLARAGQPYLYIEELDGSDLRAGLEIKPPEMWADHVCDVAFRQWSIGNEAHGVLLDDPASVWQRPYGDRVPVTFDIEWYSIADPQPLTPPVLPGVHGYTQQGEHDSVIELTEGVLRLAGRCVRVHQWARRMHLASPSSRWPRRVCGRRIDAVTAGLSTRFSAMGGTMPPSG